MAEGIVIHVSVGYYAIGTKVQFVTMTSPPSETELIFGHDLTQRMERLDNLVHLIRLCGVISWMETQLPNRANPEFDPFLLEDGTQMIIGAVVQKQFMRPRREVIHCVTHLVDIYNVLAQKQVPNVDTLVEFNVDVNHPYVVTEPVGIDQFPESGTELFNAAVCVLEALQVMHAGPSPVYHRDIRKPNIIKRPDGDGWFLIDWSDASLGPTTGVTHMSREEHSPKVREDNHGGEVDVWGVGYYLKTMAYKALDRAAVKEMGKK